MPKSKDSPLRIISIDVLKPHQPSVIELSKILANEKSVSCVNASIYAIDEKTESVRVVLEGMDIDFDRVSRVIEELGAVVHSIDKVVVGKNGVIELPHHLGRD